MSDKFEISSYIRKKVYKIITEKLDDLESAVNRALEHGATLIGGPLVDQNYFHQAVLVEEEIKEVGK